MPRRIGILFNVNKLCKTLNLLKFITFHLFLVTVQNWVANIINVIIKLYTNYKIRNKKFSYVCYTKKNSTNIYIVLQISFFFYTDM